jgi:hypothetical protein
MLWCIAMTWTSAITFSCAATITPAGNQPGWSVTQLHGCTIPPKTRGGVSSLSGSDKLAATDPEGLC